MCLLLAGTPLFDFHRAHDSESSRTWQVVSGTGSALRGAGPGLWPSGEAGTAHDEVYGATRECYLLQFDY